MGFTAWPAEIQKGVELSLGHSRWVSVLGVLTAFTDDGQLLAPAVSPRHAPRGVSWKLAIDADAACSHRIHMHLLPVRLGA